MQKTPILVFDLDDTLYDESVYVKSGFSAVANYLENRFGVDSNSSFLLMEKILRREGRGAIFDQVLKEHQLFTKQRVKKLLSIYRQHKPHLELYPDAKALLEKNRGNPLYLVTDGNKNVQAIKVKALKLDETMKKCYLTYRYGRDKSKPSPYCFLKICKEEKVSPSDIIYIGDNPLKDFVGLKPLLFQTVRILRGPYKDLKVEKAFEADRVIKSLHELL